MTDLSKGIIELDGFSVTAQTTKAELIEYFGEKLDPLSDHRMIRFTRFHIVDGQEYSVWFYFNSDSSFSMMTLRPFLDYKSAPWDLLGQQKERREVCDKWLFEKLGLPHEQTKNGIYYRFADCSVYATSDFEMLHNSNCGLITVDYMQQGR